MSDKNYTFNVKQRPLRTFIVSLFLLFITFSLVPICLLNKKESPIYENIQIHSFLQNKKDQKTQEKELLNMQNIEPSIPLSTNILPKNYNSNLALKYDVNFKSSSNLNFELVEFSKMNSEFESLDVVNILSLDKIPALIKSSAPKYPHRLLTRSIEGFARLEVLIDKDGKVSLIRVIEASDDLFANSAIENLDNLLYESPLKNGKKVKASFILPIKFNISGK